MSGLMPAAFTAANALERRDQQLLFRRRERAEARLSRERKRNSRLAFAGFVAAAVAVTVGIQTTLAPAAVPVPVAQLDPADLELARTHVGYVLLTTDYSDYCRELRFDNDSGRFSDGGRYRCFIDNEPTLNPSSAAPHRANDVAARAGSIRTSFKAR
jgi:hypothetical protein